MRFLLSVILALPLSAAAVDGIKVHWFSAGTGTETLIFVHGWTCDETSWSMQVPPLSQQYRVITLDLPGHGRSGSPKSGTFSMDLFARAVEAVRKEAKVDKAVLVGHSMGTPVILRYEQLYPQRVAGLVLVDGLVRRPSSGPAPPPARVGGPDGMKAREAMIRGMFTPATPPALQQQILKMMLSAPEATATGAMLATMDALNSKIDPISVPVLGIYAEKSRLGDREYMKQIFPSLEYVEVSGTGHFVMMEKPEEFNRLLIAFVDKIQQ
jgi:pimeloyl-ACP methyl ester carboxylesterase